MHQIAEKGTSNFSDETCLFSVPFCLRSVVPKQGCEKFCEQILTGYGINWMILVMVLQPLNYNFVVFVLV